MPTNTTATTMTTSVFTALAESPGAPVLLLAADPNRRKAFVSVSGHVALAEDAAGATAARFVLQGGFRGLDKVVELNTTGEVWALGYTGGTPAIVRVLVERWTV